MDNRVSDTMVLKKEAVSSTENLLPTYQNTRCHISEVHKMNIQRLTTWSPKMVNWSIKQCFDSSKPSDYYTYGQFNIQQFYLQPTQCICVFCVDLRINSDYFPYSINWLGFITETECLLRGTDWIFISNSVYSLNLDG
jgi:hypothetical protein